MHVLLVYLSCFFFHCHSKEKGEKDLALRKAIAAGENPSNVPESTRSHDPFPVPHPDGSFANPLVENEDVRKPVMEIAEKDDPVSTTFSESQLPKFGPSLSESSSRSVTPESVDSHGTSSPELTGHISSTSSRGDGGYFSHSGSLKGSLISPPSLSHSPFSSKSDYSPQSDQVFYSEVEAEGHPVSLPPVSSSLIKMEGYASLTQACEPQTPVSLLSTHANPPKHCSPSSVQSPHLSRPHVPNVATSFVQAPYNPEYRYGYRNIHPRAQPCVKQEMPDFGQIPANPPSFQLPQHYGSNPLSQHAQDLNLVLPGNSLHQHPVQPLPMLSPEDLMCMDRTTSFNPSARPGGFYHPQMSMSYRYSH